MPKALGIISVALAIVALIVISLRTLGFLGIGFNLAIIVTFIEAIAMVALGLGIGGVASAKGKYSRAPGIAGIVIGAVTVTVMTSFWGGSRSWRT